MPVIWGPPKNVGRRASIRCSRSVALQSSQVECPECIGKGKTIIILAKWIDIAREYFWLLDSRCFMAIPTLGSPAKMMRNPKLVTFLSNLAAPTDRGRGENGYFIISHFLNKKETCCFSLGVLLQVLIQNIMGTIHNRKCKLGAIDVLLSWMKIKCSFSAGS